MLKKLGEDSAESAKKAETRRTRRKRSGQATPSKEEEARKPVAQPGVQAFVGFEYECSYGHRFIQQLPKGKAKADFLLSQEQPLYCSCKEALPQQHAAQLARIFLVVPPNPDARAKATEPHNLITIVPKVQLVKTAEPENRLVFEIDSLVVVPDDTTVAIRLPYVYSYNGSPLNPADYHASLLPGSLVYSTG